MSPVAKLEDELQRIIKNGPFLEAELKLNVREDKTVKMKK